MLIPLLKVDAVNRLIYARFDETPDRAGEVFDYVSSKPNFEKWSSDQVAASNGLSKGNVRAMHGRVAAGIVSDLTFDDAAKAINFCLKITDDAEWLKVETGTYTGISPGGSYGRRWRDGALTRYTAKPGEISLADVPCNPGATFLMTKADGLEEQVAFITVASKEDLEKAGRRHSQRDLDSLQAIHDHACTMGAICQGDAAEKAILVGDLAKMSGDADRLTGDLAKVAAELSVAQADLAKLAGERDTAQADLTKMSATNTQLTTDLATAKAKIVELEKMAAPGGPVLQQQEALEKSAQSEADRINAMPDGIDKANALMKLTIRTPGHAR